MLDWLKDVCSRYTHEPVAIYRAGTSPNWPLEAANEVELQRKLAEGRHFLPLPKEPAALANVVEVSVVDFILRQVDATSEMVAQRGTERGYPDIDFSGAAFGGGYHAVDIKVARRAKNGWQTDSRITLYTGNTYFRYPQLRWPGTFRPFEEYESHLDIIVLYTLDELSLGRLTHIELIATEAWRIASKQRSSTTREYLGAVKGIDDLREGRGEFATEAEFYAYWRKFPFKTGRVVEQQLRKLLSERGP